MPHQTRPHVRLLFRPEYVYDVLEAGARHTFDTEKPRRIHRALIDDRLAQQADFVAPDRVSGNELLSVHSPDYLEQIARPETLARLLFLDPAHPWDARLADPFLFATGGTVRGARLAVAERALAVNLGGGYHHAQADKAEGFCAIADVAIAIRLLQRARLVHRVLIVDLDYHHGNGNAVIFANDESVFTFSIHAGNWCWIAKRNNLDIELPSGTGDDAYLGTLAEHLPGIVRDFSPDFAVYVAGSDPFEGDLLGDFKVTEAGMLARDRFVTQAVWGRGIPMLVVTAGGYGPQSWRIHFNYFRWLLAADAPWE
ncbi:histone deacetylase [Candidatus Binatia bacterium]|nr:histone deacetylase [Candidatus Binatia bacterium]